MAKKEEQPKTDSQRTIEGQILARIILEMLGAPKDHIEKTMKDYVGSLNGNPNFEIIKTFISEAEEQAAKPELKLPKDQKLFSAYAELEIWFKGAGQLVEFCFDSLPSSIEILEPEEFKLKANQFSGLLNDLQAKLHRVDLSLKTHRADVQAAGFMFKTLVANFIGHCIRTGISDVGKMAEIIGVEKDKLQKIIDDLAEKKIILKNGNTYSVKEKK